MEIQNCVRELFGVVGIVLGDVLKTMPEFISYLLQESLSRL